mmetsp:Transcript_23127/g.30047  ORF Transcript_23127/g.30047 Transcript_23127/m.30047 type:complete len:415 (-) Transcript_23127:200-1444(-)
MRLQLSKVALSSLYFGLGRTYLFSFSTGNLQKTERIWSLNHHTKSAFDFHSATENLDYRQKSRLMQSKRKALQMASFEKTVETLSIFATVPEGAKAIGTHDGTFHCDESLAVAMLRTLPEFEDSVVVRTRDSDELGKCEIVVDVGAEYDPERLRFDHHQKTFEGTLDGYSTKLSSAGLVYKHYGMDIIKRVADGKFPDEIMENVYKKVYENFVESIDGIDNGVEPFTGDRNYRITTDLSSRVGRLNPSWNEEWGPAILNDRFKQAVELTGSEFTQYILDLANSWWPARDIVQRAILDRTNVHESGQVVKFDQFAPWKSHLFDLEKDLGIDGQIKYVLYADTSGKWRIQAVPVEEGSFASRLALPEEWRGLRDDDLSEKSGIQGGVFVHASGFIGGNVSEEGVLLMAKKSLEMQG